MRRGFWTLLITAGFLGAEAVVFAANTDSTALAWLIPIAFVLLPVSYAAAIGRLWSLLVAGAAVAIIAAWGGGGDTSPVIVVPLLMALNVALGALGLAVRALWLRHSAPLT